MTELERKLRAEVSQAWDIVTEDDIDELMTSETEDDFYDQRAYLSEVLYVAIYHLNQLRDTIKALELEDIMED